MRCAKHPEKNTQNLMIAYILVFFAYILMGTFGYIGFIGTLFKDYFVRVESTSHRALID